jgi:hypothetical protein
MERFWVIVVLILLVVISLLVLPLLTRQVHEEPIMWGASSPPRVVAPTKVMVKPMQGMRDEDGIDKAMLDAHYIPARPDIPHDYPQKRIGACPDAKAPASDLPIRDIPLCLARKSGTMKLV